MAGTYDQDMREMRRRARLELIPRPIDKAFLDDLNAELAAVSGITGEQRDRLYRRIAASLMQVRTGLIPPRCLGLVAETVVAPLVRQGRIGELALNHIRDILHRALARL